jgi:cytochrome c2
MVERVAWFVLMHRLPALFAKARGGGHEIPVSKAIGVRFPIFSRGPGLVAAGLACALAAYGLGFVTAEHGLYPSRYIAQAQEKLGRIFRAALPEWQDSTRTLSTMFVRLRLDEASVPVSRAGEGGGMTSLGDDVLLLTHEGTVFGISGTKVRATAIKVPDNGYDRYRAAAEAPPYQSYRHRLGSFRYNDIVYFSDGAQAGLAVSYTEWLDAQACYGAAVALLPLSPADDSVRKIEARSDLRWEVIYRSRPCLPLKREFNAIEGHLAGGRMAYRAPGRLLIGIGDHHWDGVYAPKALAQEQDNDYGKVVEIDLARRTARHVSIGNRNVQGIVVDRSGDIWAVEHGPRGGDELNLIEDGRNYGWPLATLGTRYNALPWPSAAQYGRHDDFTPPVFAFVPSVAPSNLIQIESFDPSWDGDLLVASLKARSLYRLRIANRRVEFAEPVAIDQRIRYVHQHADGTIYLYTDSNRLIAVSKDETSPTQSFIDDLIAGLELEPERQRRLADAIAACRECHAFEAGDNSSAPSLGTVFGQPIATGPYASYSDSLARHGGTWTEEELKKFLADTRAFAPGTAMPQTELAGETIADIIEVLKGLEAAE